MEIPEIIHELILARLVGEIDPEEAKDLKLWLEESAEHQKIYEDFCVMWYAAVVGTRRDMNKKEKIWADIQRRHYRRHQRRVAWQVASVAACLILILGVSRLFMKTSSLGVGEPQTETVADLMSLRQTQNVKLILSSGEALELTGSLDTLDAGTVIQSDSTGLSYSVGDQASMEEEVYNELIVPKCGEYHLTLADGTAIVINAESNLRFPVKFSGQNREVWLEGEAYFEVAHNSKQPFILHVNHTTVKVLGTSFNVMAYQNEKNTEITLVKGSVDVGVAGRHELLVPGNQFVVNNSTLQTENRKVDVFQYISWKEGMLRFDDLPLEQLMNRLSRWYDISFEFRREELKQRLFSGGFKKYEQLERVLQMIQETNDVNFQVVGNKVIIDKK